MLITSPSNFFLEVVEEAFAERQVSTYPQVKTYMVDLLTYFILTDNLWDSIDQSGRRTREMLSESLLRATGAEPRVKIEKLKKLGDHSLYVSGFFSDSLQRKIIDVDYYVDMGRTAFDALSSSVDEDTHSQLYREIAQKFVELVDVLTLISQKAMIADEENLLRLMDVYSRTGSPLLAETLVEKGFFNLPTKKQMKNEQ